MKNKPKIDCVDLEPRTNETAPSVAVESVSAEDRQGLFEERPLPVIEIAPRSCVIGPGATFCCLGLAR